VNGRTASIGRTVADLAAVNLERSAIARKAAIAKATRACGIPGFSDEAFVFNATVVPDGDLLYITLWPEGESQPTVSTLNAADGAITSNMAIVPSGSGNDSIDAFAASDTQLILDISSYFAPITALSVGTAALPGATVSNSYSVPLVAIGGVAPYTWSITSGTLPPGLNLSSSGTISGTPTNTGNSSFTVKATDSNSPASTATMNLGIAVGTSAGTPTITTTTLPAATVKTPYNVLLAANGGYTPYSWSVVPSEGNLPTGLSLNASTGQISGTPGAGGFAEFFVKVTDAQNQTYTQELSIWVNTGDANGTLNGMYAMSFIGFSHSAWFVSAASFTFDGNGHVTAGEMDSNYSATGAKHVTITGGTYSVDSNGLGQISWTDSSGGGGQVLIATGNADDMRIIGYNTNGTSGTWGAGVMRQQNPTAFNAAALAGNWAFGLQGQDLLGDPLAADGSYAQNSSGGITNGSEDINDYGTHNQVSFTGQSTTGIDANGRATLQLTVDGEHINEVTYVISANEVIFLDIDTGGNLYLADGLRQSGTMNNGILNGEGVGPAAEFMMPVPATPLIKPLPCWLALRETAISASHWTSTPAVRSRWMRTKAERIRSVPTAERRSVLLAERLSVTWSL
jgi:hypothetical protein